MTKAELVRNISRNTDMNSKDVLAVVEEFMTEVKKAFIRREEVYLRGFGSFIIKHRAKKTIRNLKQNKRMEIPAIDIPGFRAGKDLQAQMRKTQTL